MSYWKLYYHFVWATKYRLPLIDVILEPRLYGAIGAKVRETEGKIFALGGIEDHVHIVVAIPPKLAPAKFIGDVKGNSSHFINYVVKQPQAFCWQDEYAVFTVDEKNPPTVVGCVKDQKAHHARGTVISALEPQVSPSPR